MFLTFIQIIVFSQVKNFIFKVNAQEIQKATSVPKSLLSSNEEVAESNLPEAKEDLKKIFKKYVNNNH